MTREELENFVKEKSGGVVLYTLLWMAIKLGIRYGFEKAREIDTNPALHENAKIIRPLYKSVEQVIKELDEEQDV